ncbi:MAG: hypothetical protein M5U34_45740 [Chloroflexi bacterium]|nr:hypothetical protein [Chloroflexota bacterium]
MSAATWQTVTPPPAPTTPINKTAAALVLNFEQGLAWRSLPPVNKEMGETAVSIPSTALPTKSNSIRMAFTKLAAQTWQGPAWTSPIPTPPPCK